MNPGPAQTDTFTAGIVTVARCFTGTPFEPGNYQGYYSKFGNEFSKIQWQHLNQMIFRALRLLGLLGLLGSVGSPEHHLDLIIIRVITVSTVIRLIRIIRVIGAIRVIKSILMASGSDTRY